jgi:peptidoglycan/LPS O-acetylase OafA/YrhL
MVRSGPVGTRLEPRTLSRIDLGAVPECAGTRKVHAFGGHIIFRYPRTGIVRAAGALRVNKQRLIWLDALRGLSALAVVLFHASVGQWASHGYLAVDAFFVLSGVVIARAYEERLKRGATAGWFLRQRLARLYPLYVFGLLLGLVRLTHTSTAPLTIAAAFFGGLGFLPVPVPSAPLLYPINMVMWSLALEMLVNLAYGYGGWRLPDRWLAGIAAIAGILFAGMILMHGDASLGANAEPIHVIGGLARVIAEFSLGVLLYRNLLVGGERKTPRRRLAPVALIAIGAVYMVPSAPQFGGYVDLIALGVIVVVVIELLRAPSPVGRLASSMEGLGALSYPIYVVHLPLLALAMVALPLGLGVTVAFGAILIFGVALAAHLTIEPMGRRMILGDRRLALARSLGL